MAGETLPQQAPMLPPNVSIYSGPSSEQLLNASFFTRLATTVHNESDLSKALESCKDFCLQQRKSVLIFGETGDAGLDQHHEHFRLVCLKLKEHGDIGLEYARCVFDASTSLEAGFQLDTLSKGSIMVIDLQEEDDDSDEDEDDDDNDDDDEDPESVLASLGEVTQP